MNKLRRLFHHSSWRGMRRFWKRTRRIWTAVLMMAVAVLLVQLARDVEWREVWSTLRQMPVAVLVESACLVPVAYLAYSSYDLLGRAYTGHKLRKLTTLMVAFVSYAANVNLGALVGGVGLRFRLYSKLGLRVSVISKVLAMSIFTNWLGYVFLFGVLFTMHEAPAEWRLSPWALRAAGLAMLALTAGYLALCAFARRRHLHIAGRHIPLPTLRIAALQLVLSVCCWGALGGILYLLFGREVSYTLVLAALLLSSIAGAIVHMPGGVGVLEAVFVAMLAHEVPKSQVLGTLLAYRALYYLGPLMIAMLMYAMLEARLRRQRGATARAAPAQAAGKSSGAAS